MLSPRRHSSAPTHGSDSDSDVQITVSDGSGLPLMMLLSLCDTCDVHSLVTVAAYSTKPVT